jgi:hypothetical protein
MLADSQVLVALVGVLVTVATLSTLCVGALCWFLRQLVSKTIPALLLRQDKALEGHQADREQHREAIGQIAGRMDKLETGISDIRARLPSGIHYDAVPSQRGADA